MLVTKLWLVILNHVLHLCPKLLYSSRHGIVDKEGEILEQNKALEVIVVSFKYA